MSTETLTAQMRAARRTLRAPSVAQRTADALARQLADLPREVALALVRTLRARLAELELAQPDPDLLARLGAAWVSAVADVSQTDPAAAGELHRAMLARLRAYRPDVVPPLDTGFVPTEPIPTEVSR